MEIFGILLAVADFPAMKSIRGLGMADQMECASLLESRFDYRNTFYHEAPRFDVSQPPEEGEFEDRTRWARELDAQVQQRAAETARLYDELNPEKFRSAPWEASRWIHPGRVLGLGPKL
jgi:hypothetical protein